MEFKLNSIEEVGEAAKKIITFAEERKVWVFDGSMGAGKTTLIKAIAIEYGILDETSSPTFSLVNVYEDANGEEYYHFDFYRIEEEMEAVDIGCDEYFYSGNHCFIEWAERIPSLIPDQYIKISIILEPDNTRTVRLSKHD
ncbi:tRNA (adenosine(37)-N6)-threonylcarbamoyltransferase complex ATPase subunit type 1 TsaE [Reichenbachiella versicolor]|uniref:tRNA (adenosine(37)-N6)-threonylcarbamoyltransferase complex ATPase subunit type 1 TsaE n=1 Tax=Reichenbachiella versicolor TaxID=1821036 RepID=UPI000D6E149A|nr:tRNA (adenosine(37)-N6)-threonylcarbamoyltransferase complex ATPase subunit type 1 TsaE [Reichenbachiella versicolor]